MSRLCLILLASVALAAPPVNSVTIQERTGSTQSNYPVQLGRVFIAGEIPNFPQAKVDGTPVTTTADCKNRWSDGSCKVAVLFFSISSLTASSTVTITFQNQLTGNNAPITKASMLADYDFNVIITFSNGCTSVVDARTMLNAWDGSSSSALGPVQYWVQGSVATSIILADHSATRAYDVCGTAQAFRPIFHLTFWAAPVSRVYVRVIGENSHTSALQDLLYDFKIEKGNASPTQFYPTSGVKALSSATCSDVSPCHIAGSRWTRTTWIGTTPGLTAINHNLTYLKTTKLIYNYDTSKVLSESIMASRYATWGGVAKDLYRKGQMDAGMENPGGRGEIGPFPAWHTWYLYSGDYRMAEMMYVHTDLAAAWPMHFREHDSAKWFDKGHTVSGLGRPATPEGRPNRFLNDNNNYSTSGGADALPVANSLHGPTWQPGGNHTPGLWVLPYLFTGEYWYLEQLHFWVAWASFYANPGNVYYGRGPTGATGRIYTSQARGNGWGIRDRAYAATLFPDGSIEKTYWTAMVADALAIWEGERGVTDGIYNGTSLWTWGTGEGRNVFRDPHGQGNPVGIAPLRFWESAATLVAEDPTDATKTHGVNSPWMNSYVMGGLSIAEDLGFATTALKRWFAQWFIGGMTSPDFAPHYFAVYRMPALNGHASLDSWLSTWAAVKDAYDAGYDPVPQYTTYLGDAQHGYPYSLMWAVSNIRNEPGGEAAWNFSASTALTRSELNDDPKFAIIPRESTIGTVTVPSATSTGAIISYTAPTTAACTVEVSELADLSVLSHDFNSTLFSGSNLDSRAGSLTRGRARIVVAGKRTAEIASDGIRYSRALAAATKHYGRITCGSEVSMFSFTTDTIKWGNAKGTPIPFDRANPGQTAWPTWDFANRAQVIIDPETGAKIRHLTFPKMERQSGGAERLHSSTAPCWTQTNWTNVTNIYADDASSASYTGSTQDRLLCGIQLGYSEGTVQPDAISVFVKGSAGASGDAGKTQVALTIDGVNPYGKWIDVDIPTCGAAGCTVGDNATATESSQTQDVLAAWLNVGQSPPSTHQRQLTRGRTTASSGVLTYNHSGANTSGFGLHWVAGSRIEICNDTTVDCPGGYTTYTIASVASSISATVTDGALTFASARDWRANGPGSTNVGILHRKKTTSTDAVNIQHAKYAAYPSFRAGFNGGSGSTDHCADRLTQGHTQAGVLDGTYGYHCLIASGDGGIFVFWIRPSDGDVRYLGPLWVPNASIGGSVVNLEACTQSSATWDTRDATDALYCKAVVSATSKRVIVKANYTGQNKEFGTMPSTGNNGASWTWSLATATADLNAEIAALNPLYDTTKYTPDIIGLQNGHLVLSARRGVQDTYGWLIMYDPVAKLVKGTLFSPAAPGCRWCGGHTTLSVRDAPWVFFQTQNLGTGSTGGGPYDWTFSTAWSASPYTDCATAISAIGQSNVTGVTGAKCTTVTMTGDPVSAVAETSLQNAIVGDIGHVLTAGGASDGEYARIVARNGDQVVWERGYSLDNVGPAHSSGGKVRMLCSAVPFKSYNFGSGVSGAAWWNYLSDPLGTNSADPYGIRATGATVLGDWFAPGGHVTYNQSTTIEDGGNCNAAGGVTCDIFAASSGDSNYGIRPGAWPDHVKAPNAYGVNSNIAFAGTTGVGQGNCLERHPSHFIGATSFIDARPFNCSGDGTVQDLNYTATNVAGDLYRITNIAPAIQSLKKQSWHVSGGTVPTVDISSAATGDVISGSAGDNNKHCWANKVNECRTGSSVNDLYVNIPRVSGNPTGWPNSPVGEINCHAKSTPHRNGNDICMFAVPSHHESIAQYSMLGRNQARGEGVRAISKALHQVRSTDSLWNARGLPDGSWIMSPVVNLNGSRTEIVLVKVPPAPPLDSINRATFIPITTRFSSVPATVTNVIARFGYSEFGGQFYCTTRQENCVSVTSGEQVNETMPFSWPSEGTGGVESGLTGVSCASGCTITIPALSQRMMYRQFVFRNAANATIATSEVQVVATP